MRLEYKMVQIPRNLEIRGGAHGNEAAQYLQRLVNSYARSGWEFQRVDEIGVQEAPGCLAGLFLGQKAAFTSYYVVTFRRDATAAPTLESAANRPQASKARHPESVEHGESDVSFDDSEFDSLGPDEDEADEVDLVDEGAVCLKCGETLGEFDSCCPKCGWSWEGS
jgi:hypothetical protein